jgi:hypothetical protein
MAFPSSPSEFAQVRAHSEVSRRPAHAAALVVFVTLAVVAVTMVASSGRQSGAQSMAAAQLFEEPAISLGISAHEALGKPALAAKPAVAAPAAGAKPKLASVAPGTTFEGTPNARWNYQMDNKLTWPPHDTAYIPTGAYSAGYKGPYDNDYDWPDDTQVLRNDEWDQSGGVGCGMSGNNC